MSVWNAVIILIHFLIPILINFKIYAMNVPKEHKAAMEIRLFLWKGIGLRKVTHKFIFVLILLIHAYMIKSLEIHVLRVIKDHYVKVVLMIL